MKINLWPISALLCPVAAIGFAVAYFVGGYAPYLTIAAVWAALGCQNLIAGAPGNNQESEKSDREHRRRD